MLRLWYMEKKLIDKFGEDTIQRRAQAILNADFFFFVQEE